MRDDSRPVLGRDRDLKLRKRRRRLRLLGAGADRSRGHLSGSRVRGAIAARRGGTGGYSTGYSTGLLGGAGRLISLPRNAEGDA